MSDLRKAAEMALDTLERWSHANVTHLPALYPDTLKIIEDLRHALSQPEQALDKKAANARELGLDYEPEQEPVARFNWNESKFEWLTKYSYDKHHMKPLYLAPPKRQWVGLTDEEIENLYKSIILGELEVTRWLVCRAIETKLKEKNT